VTLENNVSRALDMNVFGSSQNSEIKRTLSKLEDSIKIIQSDVKLQQVEKDVMKSNIINIQQQIKSIENEIQQYNKSLFNYENRLSELINNQADAATAIGILGLKLEKIK